MPNIKIHYTTPLYKSLIKVFGICNMQSLLRNLWYTILGMFDPYSLVCNLLGMQSLKSLMCNLWDFMRDFMWDFIRNLKNTHL